MKELQHSIKQSQEVLERVYLAASNTFNEHLSKFVTGLQTSKHFFRVYTCAHRIEIAVYSRLTNEKKYVISSTSVTFDGAPWRCFTDGNKHKLICSHYSSVIAYLREIENFCIDVDYNITIEESGRYDYITDRAVIERSRVTGTDVDTFKAVPYLKVA